MCTYTPSFLDFSHISVNTEFPVLCSRFSLVISFMHSSVYMAISISQFILSPLPSSVSMSSIYLCLYLCFANKFICSIFLDCTHKQYYMMFIFVFPCLFKLHYSISFCGLVIIPVCICTTTSLSIYLLMDIYVASMSWLL